MRSLKTPEVGLFAALALVATACAATSGGAPAPTSSETASPPPPSGPLALLRTAQVRPASHYSLMLVGADGQVVASAQAATRTILPAAAGGRQPTSIPTTSTSNSRAYFLDGDATVRFLSPNGSTGAVLTLPGTSQAQVAFAVSPDDTRIAVGVLDYATAPVGQRVFVEDLRGGNRHEVPVAAGRYAWPVGWINGNLVLAQGDPYASVSSYDFNPYQAASYLVVNSSNGTLIATLGRGCQVNGPLSPAGTACSASYRLTVVTWNGYGLSWPVSVGCPSLSPSGKGIAGCNTDFVVIARPDGSTMNLPGRVPLGVGVGIGWLDDAHVVYGCSAEPDCIGRVYDLVGKTASVVHGDPSEPVSFVSRIPGDLSGVSVQQ